MARKSQHVSVQAVQTAHAHVLQVDKKGAFEETKCECEVEHIKWPGSARDGCVSDCQGHSQPWLQIGILFQLRGKDPDEFQVGNDMKCLYLRRMNGEWFRGNKGIRAQVHMFMCSFQVYYLKKGSDTKNNGYVLIKTLFLNYI